MWREDDLLIATAAFVVLSGKNKKRKRKCWVRPSLLQRVQLGGVNIIENLNIDDTLTRGGHLNNFLRMAGTDLEMLLNSIGPYISKEDTNWRRAITSKERLLVTLRFLATGDSYHSLMYMFKMSKQVISVIIPEVCDALCIVLSEKIKLPTNEQEWKNIANEFNCRWNFPHCAGVMDGTHVMVQAPQNTGSEFFNYKGFFSIVLFAVANANYEIIYFTLGSQGRISDGGVFEATTFKKRLMENKLHLPEPESLPGRRNAVPYVFLGDEAFPLSPNILKPFPGSQDKGSPRRVFNYRLSRARRVSENVFGILSARFRVLRKPLLLEPEKVIRVIAACLYLHNFLRKRSYSKQFYTPVGTFDSEDKDTGLVIPGSWGKEINGEPTLRPLPKKGRKPSVEAQTIRQEFTDFFQTPAGSVTWQNTY